MLDHIGIAVGDIDRAKAFYTAALAPLGVGIVMEVTAEQSGNGASVGLGSHGKPFFWISSGKTGGSPLHIALTAADRATVDAFHKAALAAGGVDNGAPGIRAHYHPNYYGAFILDFDGNNIEAVCHLPE